MGWVKECNWTDKLFVSSTQQRRVSMHFMTPGHFCLTEWLVKCTSLSQLSRVAEEGTQSMEYTKRRWAPSNQRVNEVSQVDRLGTEMKLKKNGGQSGMGYSFSQDDILKEVN